MNFNKLKVLKLTASKNMNTTFFFLDKIQVIDKLYITMLTNLKVLFLFL